MTIADLMGLLIFGGMALALALTLVLVQVGVFSVERHFSRWVVPMLPLLIVMAVSVATLLSGRKLGISDFDLDVQAAGGGGVLRLFTAVVLALCIARVFGHLLRRQANVPSPVASAMFIAFLGFFFTGTALPSAFGTHPAFIHNMYYAPVLFIAIYVAREESPERMLSWCKYALIGMMLLSLALAAVKPDLVLERPYVRSWVPGLNFRFWGLGSHANSIGPLALLLLLLEYLSPMKSWIARWAAWLVGIVVLVLAQSKTAWAAAGLIGAVLAWYRWARDENGRVRIGFVLAGIGLGLLVCVGLMVIDTGRLIDKFLFTRAAGDVATLSGRAAIWQAAIAAWEANPLFGYGPEAWGPLHRMQIGMLFAYSAHNQFFQSLSVGGSVAALSFIVYFILLGWCAYKSGPATKGVSWALFLFVAARCVTEAPLAMATLFNGEILVHIMLFALALQFRPERRKAPVDHFRYAT